MIWIALIVLAACLGKLISSFLTLEDAAARMAAQHRLGRRALFHYQDRFMPRFLAPAMAALAFLVALVAGLIAVASDSGEAVLACLAGSVLPYLSHALLPPRRGAPLILRLAARRLQRRARGTCERSRLAGRIAAQLHEAHPGLEPRRQGRRH